MKRVWEWVWGWTEPVLVWLAEQICDRWGARSERDAWRERCKRAEQAAEIAEKTLAGRWDSLRAASARVLELESTGRAGDVPGLTPGLSPAQIERLAWVMEEAGEVVQAAGKVLRHGYQSASPFGGATNKVALEREMGELRAAMQSLESAGDVRGGDVKHWQRKKAIGVWKWMHHQ